MADIRKKIFLEGNIPVKEGEYTSLIIRLNNIKGLTGTIEIPLINDVFAIVGNNGTGKSTIISTLSRLVPPYKFRLNDNDYVYESSIRYTVYDKTNEWNFLNGKSKRTDNNGEIRFYGRYEGSLFYGTRFEDSSNVDYLMRTGKIENELIVDADDYIIKSLGEILHNDEDYYRGLKRLKNRSIAKELGINNLPYFLKVNGKLISQYRMSSGECLLISLLHFLYNSILRKSVPENMHALLLIDEIELALHPIAVKRLVERLIKLSHDSKNLTCIISTHSLEVIRSIRPENLYNLKVTSSDFGNRFFKFENPSYPCYLMKDIYIHSGYDFVILVEDILAAKIVEKSLLKLKLRKSKLINVIPIGGWNNVYELHKTFARENTLGVNTKILSIIDGDVRKDASSKFKNLTHIFLPVSSVEKFLRTNILLDSPIKKILKDTFFIGEKSIEDFIKYYKKNEEKLETESNQKGEIFEEDANGKRLYKRFKHFCETERKISEDSLIDILFHIIEQNIDFTEFEQNLINSIK